MHLHIHHIKEESEGGSNDFDNLIPVCLTCHSDIHTHTKLTRRFTNEELKVDRDTVITMVAEGKLMVNKIEDDDSDELINGWIQRLVNKADSVGSDIELPPHAVKILLDAAQKDGVVSDMSDNLTNSKNLDDIREMSKLKDGIDHLVTNGLLDYVRGILYRVSHKGFLLADKLIALADTTEKQ